MALNLLDKSSVHTAYNDYIIVIDAGSSGSRLNVYQYDKQSGSQRLQFQNRNSTLDTSHLPEIISNKDWNIKVTGGVSSYIDSKYEELWRNHLEPLVRKAETVIPSDKQPSTPVFFLATAGMRLLPDLQQQHILKQVCGLLSTRTNFYIPECNSHVKVIDGATEGLYGWLALNYLLGTTKNYQLATGLNSMPQNEQNMPSFGFMDMGGASAQIAFAPSSKEAKKHAEDLYRIVLRSTDGINHEWDVFVSTWLGFGANEARKRLTELLISSNPDHDIIFDACTPAGLSFPSGSSNSSTIIKGDGNFNKCFLNLFPLLNKHLPCDDDPCLFNGVHVPQFDFNRDKFVGVSEYWHTANDIFDMQGRYDFVELNKKAKHFCSLSWDQILENSRLGYYKNVPETYLQTACFKVTWIMTILHEGFGIPNIKNKRNDVLLLEDEMDDVAVQLAKRNINDFLSPFQSATSVDGNELTWSLGRAVLYTSSQVSPAIIGQGDVGYKAAKSGNFKFVPGGELIAYNENLEFSTFYQWLAVMLCIGVLFILAYFGAFGRSRRRYLFMLVTKHIPLVGRSPTLRKWIRLSKIEESEEFLLHDQRSQEENMGLKSYHSSPRVSSLEFLGQPYSKSAVNLATSTSLVDVKSSNAPSRVSSRLSMRSELFSRPQFSLDGMDSH